MVWGSTGHVSVERENVAKRWTDLLVGRGLPPSSASPGVREALIPVQEVVVRGTGIVLAELFNFRFDGSESTIEKSATPIDDTLGGLGASH